MQPINPRQNWQAQAPTNRLSASEAANPAAMDKEKEKVSEAASVLSSSSTESSKTFSAAKAIPDDIDPLWKEALTGNWNEIWDKMEEKGFDFNIAPEVGPNAGKTILWLAADQGRWDIVKRFENLKKMEEMASAFAASPKMGPDAGKTIAWLIMDHGIKEIDSGSLDPDEEPYTWANSIEFLERFAAQRESVPKERVDKGRNTLWLLYEYAIKMRNHMESQGDYMDHLEALQFMLTIPTDLTIVSHTSNSETNETLYAFLLRNGVPREFLLKEGEGDLFSLFPGKEEALVQEALTGPYFKLLSEGLKQGRFSIKDLNDEKAEQLLVEAAREKRVDFLKNFILNKDFKPKWLLKEMFLISGGPRFLGNDFFKPYLLNLDPDTDFNPNPRQRMILRIPDSPDTFFQAIVEHLGPSLEDILASDPYKQNPFGELPLEMRVPILQNVLRESCPWIDQVKDTVLVDGLQKALQLNRDKQLEADTQKAFKWLVSRMYGAWRTNNEGTQPSDSEKLQIKDLSLLVRQSIVAIEEEYKVKLVLNKPVRDAIVNGFAGFEKPLTQEKMIALIKSVCADQL